MNTRIITDPQVNNGRPTVTGTRIAAQTVLEFLAAGDSVAEVLEAYPTLSHEDVLACLDYASKLLANHFTVEKVA